MKRGPETAWNSVVRPMAASLAALAAVAGLAGARYGLGVDPADILTGSAGAPTAGASPNTPAPHFSNMTPKQRAKLDAAAAKTIKQAIANYEEMRDVAPCYSDVQSCDTEDSKSKISYWESWDFLGDWSERNMTLSQKRTAGGLTVKMVFTTDADRKLIMMQQPGRADMIKASPDGFEHFVKDPATHVTLVKQENRLGEGVVTSKISEDYIGIKVDGYATPPKLAPEYYSQVVREQLADITDELEG